MQKMVPLRLILSYFTPHILKYKWTVFFTFIGYFVAFIVSGVVIPIFVKKIIDIMDLAEKPTCRERRYYWFSCYYCNDTDNQQRSVSIGRLCHGLFPEQYNEGTI